MPFISLTVSLLHNETSIYSSNEVARIQDILSAFNKDTSMLVPLATPLQVGIYGHSSKSSMPLQCYHYNQNTTNSPLRILTLLTLRWGPFESESEAGWPAWKAKLWILGCGSNTRANVSLFHSCQASGRQRGNFCTRWYYIMYVYV